ncbi:dihydrolipoyl dehydrogenase family protein [Rubrimonas cliftonensis]|uniref:Pyruvate/2-oxoglutarate dehydrogenase complex, dihydrolipoamide dehydrogenase (E3) component n=1 Tax=Rubrimonas cliftonensis TaxID=89524 RepID=A0A1H3YVX8_9RHOB|nr:FAD-dependent oxidoreductase [Rubrimonas cliftonensis]SEA15723.1 Pyruvate/2-oxoglutarate dehydrogenase complex, dihydrolipoamide dehydrogenase (E3) component [Rubrimonas cliftonensis]
MARDGASRGTLTPDLCVIGAGSGGLSVAAGAVQMGASVVLIEAGEMGGDCLNAGCVPSKALLAAAKHAHMMGAGAPFGVRPQPAEVDWSAVRAHVRGVIDAIAPHDSQERFEGLGVTVLRAFARFVDDRTVEAGGATVRPRRFVIATGSRPRVPPIPGLAETPHLTNETLFALAEKPAHLLILGGGPIGMEMAQAHRRLGCAVTVLEAGRALGREDPEAAAVALVALRAEGVAIRENAKVAAAAGGDGVTLTLEGGETVAGSHLLVAVGRAPALDGLGLDAANIAHDDRGVTVDAGLRSVSNRRVYAVGDVAGRGQFTHLAGHHAGLVIRSALFRLPVKARGDHIPRVTFTDPEIAAVGPSEAEARAAHGDRFSVARLDLAEVDRARAERATEGFAKLLIGPGGRVLGGTVVGRGAGELIGVVALAVSKGLKAGDLAGMVAPYPTYGEAAKRAAGAHFAPKLFGNPWVKRAVRLLARFG